MGDRELILASISDPGLARVNTTPSFVFAENDLWGEFKRWLGALGGQVITLDRVKELANKPRWVEEAVEGELGVATNVPTIWDAEVGFSRADFAIAHTGTLVLSAGPGKNRTSSLIPPVNVVFVRDIVPTVADAIPKLSSRTTVLVTGPSRTADIEGVLVRGVHGPGELLVYVEP